MGNTVCHLRTHPHNQRHVRSNNLYSVFVHACSSVCAHAQFLPTLYCQNQSRIITFKLIALYIKIRSLLTKLFTRFLLHESVINLFDRTITQRKTTQLMNLTLDNTATDSMHQAVTWR